MLFKRARLMYYMAVLVTILVCSCAGDSAAYVNETKLLESIIGPEYNREVIPIVDASTPLSVDIRLALSYILDIDEKRGSISVGLYPSLSWVDDRLKWDTKEYNFTSTTISSDKVWKPDVQVWNSLTPDTDSNIHSPKVYVLSNGTIYYTIHRIANTPCEMNLVSFPFDESTCYIRLGSWVEPNRRMQMKLQENTQSVAFAGNHPSWKLQNFSVYASEFFVANGEMFTEVTLSVKVARQGSYYYRLFVAPAAVCMFVIPVIHYMPPSSNEKLTLGGLMLVTVAILFEMAEDFFPAFSLGNVPLILHYYTGLLVILFMSLLLSCLSVVIGTGESKSSRVPRFLRICCIDRLGYICCARGRTSRYDYELLHLEKALRFSAQRQTSREEDERELTEITDSDSNHADGDEAAHNHTTPNTGSGSATTEGMTEVLKTLINELQYARYKEQIKSEWLQLAMVIDRTGGLLLLLLAIIITAVITMHSKTW